MNKKSKNRKKAQKLPWTYCECGCHGLELSFGRSLYYWAYLDINPAFGVRSASLYTVHGGLGGFVKDFATVSKMNRAVRKLGKKSLVALRDEVEHQGKKLEEAKERLKQAEELFS